MCVLANGDGVLNLCLPQCDPFESDCGHEQACRPVDGGFVCVPQGTGALQPGRSTFTLMTECAPGTACAAETSACVDAAEPCCASDCDLADPVGPEGTGCADVLSDPNVGLCEAS